MKRNLGVFGLYVDQPVGMDHPFFMARTEARIRASLAARSGVALDEALRTIGRELAELFGELPRSLVEATVTAAWLDAASSGDGHA